MFENDVLLERDRSLLLLLALHEGEMGMDLLKHLPDKRASKLRGVLSDVLKVAEKKRKLDAAKSLAAVKRRPRESFIIGVDAGWIVDALSQESPQVFALLLRELPKEKAREVLRALPKSKLSAIKSCRRTTVGQDVRRVVRQKIEQMFPAVPMSFGEDGHYFESLAGLSETDFLKLIREVGVREMSAAFCEVHHSATRAILHRLSFKDAKELRRRMKEYESNTNEKNQKEAQLNLLSVDFEKVDPEDIFIEIGFSVFSKSFCSRTLSMASSFIYKLPPKSAYILKRYIDDSMSRATAQQALQTKKKILECLK